jgi:hypothetical protein
MYLLRIQFYVTDSDVIRCLLNNLIDLVQKLILINMNRTSLVMLESLLEFEDLLLNDLALFSSRVSSVLYMSIRDQ